jgi:hypothetical protein
LIIDYSFLYYVSVASVIYTDDEQQLEAECICSHTVGTLHFIMDCSATTDPGFLSAFTYA